MKNNTPDNHVHRNGSTAARRPMPRRLPAKPSKAEAEKAASNYLRADLREALDDVSVTEFRDDQLNILKVHGIYQQHDRDNRKSKSQREHTLMARARIPSGVLTADQYLALDELAREYGNGSIRLTTRQSIQYHGVLKGDVRPLIRAMNARLVSTLAACGDVMRNVMCCPALLNDPVRSEVQRTAMEIAHTLAPRSGAYHEVWLDGRETRVRPSMHERRERAQDCRDR
jgi:sulfite reductase (ferredoxin)